MAKFAKKSADLVEPAEPPAPVEPVTPDESPAPVQDAARIEDVIELAPAASGPDASAAVASLELVTAPAPGQPAAPGQTGDILSGPVSGPVKDPKRWSERKIARASRAELKKRVHELQEAPPPAPAAGVAAVAPVDASEVTQLLKNVFPAADACLVFFGGKELAATSAELELLAKTFTAPVLPHYEALRAKVPLVPAIAAALGVYVPKVLARMQAARDAKATAPAVAPVFPDASTSAPAPAPEPVHPAAVPAESEPGAFPLMPFGGPNE